MASGLEAAGFAVGSVTEGAGRASTAVEHPAGRSAEARPLARALGVEPVPSAAVDDVTVVLGVDDVHTLLVALRSLPAAAPPGACPSPSSGG